MARVRCTSPSLSEGVSGPASSSLFVHVGWKVTVSAHSVHEECPFGGGAVPVRGWGSARSWLGECPFAGGDFGGCGRMSFVSTTSTPVADAMRGIAITSTIIIIT